MSLVTSSTTETTRVPHALRRAVRLLHVRPWQVTESVALGSLALGCSVALAAVSAWLIARASQMPLVLDLSIAVVGVRAFGIGRGVFRYLERIASHRVALGGMVNLREQVYSRLARGRSDAIVALRRGDLLARVGADVDAVGDVVVRGLIPTGVAIIVSLGSVVAIWCFLPAAGLALALSLIAVGILAPLLSIRAARLAEERASSARTRVSTEALALLDGAGEFVVAGADRAGFARLADDERDLARALDSTAGPAAWALGVTQLAMGAAVLASLLLGIPALHAGTLADVELAVIVLTPLAAFEAVGALPAAAQQVFRSRAAAARIMALLDAANPAHGSPDAAPASASEAVVTSRVEANDTPETDDIAPILPLIARGLSCGWPDAAPVLCGLDLEVGAGSAVAIVGPSGTGKTTLLLTLAGLLEPAGGSVCVGDGEATHALSPDRRAISIALTSEDAHVFATSLWENLRVARGDVTAEEAEASLRDVGLTSWYSALPDGLDTLLGPGGTTVSGGERRRLLLARSLQAPARVWLLDEPGEHLDAASADAMTAMLAARARAREAGHGLVIVTHRLTGLEAFDEIIAIEDGRVRARGTHHDLLEHDPSYRWAWQRQSEA